MDMKKIIIISLLVIGIFVAPAYAYCPLLYEYTNGMNRICVYDCLEGQVAITIDILSLCPLSLR